MITMLTSSSRRSNSSTEPRRLGVIAVAAVSLLSVLMFAPPARAADEAAAPDAAKLWTKNCQSCHGPDGKGKTKAGEKAGVKDLTSAEVKGALNHAKAVESMKNGVKAKDSDKLVMKSFADKLSAAEMDALADYTLKLK